MRNRLGGTITFGDLSGFNTAYWGSLRPNFLVNPGDVSFSPFTATRWETWCTISPSATGGIWSASINSYGPLYNYPYSLEIETNNDYKVMANIVLVEPGQNTAAEPGYSLKISGYKWVVATDPNDNQNTGYGARVKFEIWTIAGETLIATIDPYGNGQNYTPFNFSGDSNGLSNAGEALDLIPRLILLNDGTNLYFLILAINYVYGVGGARGFATYGSNDHTLYINDNILKNVWELTDSDSAIEDVEIDPEYGNYSTDGGYKPSFDDSSDTIPIPAKPSLGVTTTGFQNVYIVTAADIASIGSEIFPIPTAGTDVLSALNSLIDVQSSTNLSNYVVDCRILPVAAANTGVNTNISIAGRTLNSTGKPVTDDYVDVDCGSVSIPERYGNFADYEPYTTAKLYLPFVGFVPVHIEFLKKLQVKYRFNVIDGSFVVYVLATSDKSELNESVVGQYAGCACVHIPFSGLDYANFNRQVAGSIVGTISGVVNTAAGLASGNLAQATKGGAGIISGVAQGVSAKPDYQQSNAYTGSTSFMTVRTPYLLIGRPEPQFSANYPKENGLPLNVKKTLSSCSGFTVCGDVVVSGINCTDIEKEMIVNELKAGVIL